MAKKKNTARPGIFGMVTSRMLMVIVAAMLVLSYISVVINPAKVWIISLVGLIFIDLSALNLFLLLWAFKSRS